MPKISLPPVSEDEKYMKEAIRQAKKALALNEVPIGCVIVHEGKIIGRGYNRRMTDHTTLAHAEIIAIRKACRQVGDWRLENCRIYMSYNGEQGYAVSNQLTVAGYYRLEIEDEAGNRREYHLRIRPSYHLFDARIIIAGILFLIVVAVWMMMQRRNMQVL